MTTIKVVVRGGRLEVDEPVNLPDGTELLIPLPNAPGPAVSEAGWDNSPEGVADWLRWFDSLPTLKITAAEEAEAEAWFRKMDTYGQAQLEAEADD